MQKLHQVMLLYKHGVITPLKENCFAKTYFLYYNLFCMTQSEQVMVFCFQNFLTCCEKKELVRYLEERLKFEAEGREFAKFLRSLEQEQ